MSQERHFTARRGFIGAMGFGAPGLYATWATYGASPLPFAGGSESGTDPHADHSLPSSGGGHADPAFNEPHGASALSPPEFERRHADFLTRFRQADGSIRPIAVASSGVDHDHTALAEPTSMPGTTHTGHDTHAPAPDRRRARSTGPINGHVSIY